MKTFNNLEVGDTIWLSRKKARTIIRIEPTRQNGKAFSFKDDGPTPDSEITDRVEVGPSKLDRSVHHRNGNPDAKFFACREAAIENDISVYRHFIHCIEGEIEYRKQKIAKYRECIDALNKEKEETCKA